MRFFPSVVALTLVLASCGVDASVEVGVEACAELNSATEIGQWTSADGCAVPTEVVHSHAGPSECGWELVDYLVLGERTYHWDPVNFLAYVDGQTRNRTVRVADLGVDVADSGFRRGAEQLWHDPADPTYVYVVSGTQADRYLLDADNAIACS